jgi:hypothetical protein
MGANEKGLRCCSENAENSHRSLQHSKKSTEKGQQRFQQKGKARAMAAKNIVRYLLQDIVLIVNSL